MKMPDWATQMLYPPATSVPTQQSSEHIQVPLENLIQENTTSTEEPKPPPSVPKEFWKGLINLDSKQIGSLKVVIVRLYPIEYDRTKITLAFSMENRMGDQIVERCGFSLATNGGRVYMFFACGFH
jgi:hypothetical protein